MEINKIVYAELEKLNANKKMAFGIFCCERIIELYAVFDKMIAENELESLAEHNDGTSIVVATLQFTKQLDMDNVVVTNEAVRNRINECVRLIPDDDDYDGGIETALGQLTAASVGYLLEYYLKRDEKFIQRTSNAVINVVNNIISDDYYNTHPGGTYEEKEAILAAAYQKEVAIQLAFIGMLENNTGQDEKDRFTQANKIKLTA